MTTNIGDSIDPFYRYKRPLAVLETKKNTTIISNIDAIAKSLHTEPKYILYYIQLAKSTSVSTRGEIKMVLNKAEIENIINQFISEYILCQVCNYPELVIKKEKNQIYSSCNACGNSCSIPENKFTKIIYRDYAI